MTTKGAPAAGRNVQLDIEILGRAYKVACREDERTELLDAVALLDRRMREIRDSGKIAAIDRIAVMAALNFANELLRERKSPRSAAALANTGVDGAAARRRIESMHAAIDQALAGQEKLF